LVLMRFSSFSARKKEQTMIRMLERAGYMVTRAAA